MSTEPFSVVILARDIPAAGKEIQIRANESERRLLAEALDIPEIIELSADLRISPVGDSDFSLRGSLRASVVQTDVVTLDPVRNVIDEAIEVTLTKAEGELRPRQKEVIVDPTQDDERDIYRNGRIDVGVIVSEHLALALDPYPRAPDSAFAGHVEDDPSSDPSPFAALSGL